MKKLVVYTLFLTTPLACGGSFEPTPDAGNIQTSDDAGEAEASPDVVQEQAFHTCYLESTPLLAYSCTASNVDCTGCPASLKCTVTTDAGAETGKCEL